MTKKILDISLSILLIACAFAIMMGLFAAKSTLDHYFTAIEDARKTQRELVLAGKKIQEVLFEAGFAVAVIAMADEKIIPPTDAEKMVSESLDKISQHSERMGTLAKYINLKLWEILK